MEKTNIAKELRLMADMVESWTAGTLSEIEKDTVLAGLREVYNDIKHYNGGACTEHSAASGAGEDGAAEHAAVVSAATEGMAQVQESVETPVPENQESPVGGAAEAAFHAPENTPETQQPPVQVTAPETAEAAPDTETSEQTDDRTPDYDVDITEVPAAVEESAPDSSFIVNSQDEKEEFRENILFDEGEIPAKPKLDKRAILSLYGDDPAPAPRPAVQEHRPSVSDLNAVYSEEPVHNVPPVVETTAQVSPAPGDAEPVQVLGDVLGNGSQTVSDMYCGNGEVADVASVVGSGRVDSIRKAIGINDKFLLIRNLFDGNSDVYENTITTLDGFGDLDDALIYILENFHWNPDSDAVKLLVDVLTRKLS